MPRHLVIAGRIVPFELCLESWRAIEDPGPLPDEEVDPLH
jgi:hypothetical protein